MMKRQMYATGMQARPCDFSFSLTPTQPRADSGNNVRKCSGSFPRTYPGSDHVGVGGRETNRLRVHFEVGRQ